MRGTNVSAMAELTRRVSVALHTAGYWILESRATFSAMSWSANSSTYT